MSNHISFLELENFKSIKKLSFETKRINIFIGKPNVGKSNILKAMSLLGASYFFNGTRFNKEIFRKFIRFEKIRNLFYDQNKTNTISIKTDEVDAKLSYSEEDNYYSVYLSNTVLQIDEEAFAINPTLYLKQLKDYREKNLKDYSLYVTVDDIGEKFSQLFISANNNPFKKYDFSPSCDFEGFFSNYLLPTDGNNLITIFENFPSIIKEVAPFFKEYALDLLIDKEDNVLEIQKKVDGLSYKIPYSLTADTLRRIIFYLAAILSNKDSVIMLEEAEDGEAALFRVDYKDYQTTATLISDEEIANIYENGIDIFSVIR